MKRLLANLLVNPAAGRGVARRELPRLRALAGRAGLACEVSDGLDDLVARARHAVASGAERLLVAGGDGTVHHVIQALAGRATALAVLPVGRGNDLAATLGMPRELDDAFRIALQGPVRHIDLGRVSHPGDSGGRWFVGVAGVGFDSEVAHYSNEHGRFLRGPLVYPYGVVRALASFRPPTVGLSYRPWNGHADAGAPAEVAESPEVTVTGRVLLVAFANTHRFGGGMRIAPDAVPDDGLLDVVIVHRVPRWRLLTLFPSVYSGDHVGHPAVEIVRTRRVHLTLDREMFLQGDGEPMSPVTGEGIDVEVVPEALAVVGAG